jgi:hypothetical protein
LDYFVFVVFLIDWESMEELNSREIDFVAGGVIRTGGQLTAGFIVGATAGLVGGLFGAAFGGPIGAAAGAAAGFNYGFRYIEYITQP